MRAHFRETGREEGEQAMAITLYAAPRACALVPYIALREAQADFKVVMLDLGTGEQHKDAYRAINPKMRVPALAVDGTVLTENVAVLAWIAHTYPAAQLIPSEPMAHAQALSLMAWFASAIHPALTAMSRPALFCDLPETAERVKHLAQVRLASAFDVAARRLAAREWFFETFGTADAYFFWCVRRAGQLGMDFSAYPNCLAHFERVTRRPSTQKVLAHEADVLQARALQTRHA